MSQTKTITLVFPDDELIGKGITTLTMRPPRAKDEINAAQLAKTPSEAEPLLFAEICGVDRTVIENLQIHDYKQVQQAYGFFEKGGHRPKPGN